MHYHSANLAQHSTSRALCDTFYLSALSQLSLIAFISTPIPFLYRKSVALCVHMLHNCFRELDYLCLKNRKVVTENDCYKRRQ